MNEPELEFVWVGDDAIDPLEQAQTLEILVGAGIKTREEARADLGLAPSGGGAAGPVSKTYDPDQPRDDDGKWTASGNDHPVGPPARKPRRTQVQVASNDAVRPDAGGLSPSAYTGRGGEEPKPSTESDPGAIVANITCEDLLESDYAICNSAAFEDDHHYRGLCMRNMLARNTECLGGFPISPLLPY